MPELSVNLTAHKKSVWEYHMREPMNTERVLEGSLCNLFAVLMSLCDSYTRNQVESAAKYPDLKKGLDSMGLLAVITSVHWLNK